MKIKYYFYELMSQDGRRYACDIRPFLKQYARLNDPSWTQWKNTFRHAEEHIYLLETTAQDCYMLLRTANNEFIHKINRNNLSVSDIEQSLSQNEEIGFASYIYLTDRVFAIASTFAAPRQGALNNYLNQLLRRLADITGMPVLHFFATPVEDSVTQQEIEEMHRVGQIAMHIPSDTGLWDSLLDILNISASDSNLLEVLEISIKPKRGNDIREIFSQVAIHHSSTERFIVSAKANENDVMLDYYLESRGIHQRAIRFTHLSEVPHRIQETVESDESLPAKIREHLSNDAITEETPEMVSLLSDAPGWANLMDRIQADD